jgi:hypothetical protein
MKQFVPVTDEMLFDAANFAGPLVPYQFGILCARQLRDEPLPTVGVAARANAVSAPPSEHHRV